MGKKGSIGLTPGQQAWRRHQRDDIPPPPRGSWFRVIDYPPGMTGRMHRTDTIDYVICMAGGIAMELDDGAMVRMTAGDVMIQQGTNHSWINDSAEPCRIAFALLDAGHGSRPDRG